MAKKGKDPRSPSEWQEAADAASGLRAIADAKMYGLIAGGPAIDVARCDKILQEAARRGIRPSKPSHDLAIAMVKAINHT
jgi:hypothetical protein